MILKTGFGYYVAPDGRKLHKFELEIGDHPDPIGFKFVEVANKAELDKIVLDKSDRQIEWEKKNQERSKLRESAIKKLGITNEEAVVLFGA